RLQLPGLSLGPATSSGMDLADVLQQRRMGRHFSTDPVPHETLARIAAAARKAPSAGFSQGQRLVVVTDEGLKRRVAKGADEDEYPPPWGRWVGQGGAQFVPCAGEELYP